MFRVDSRGRDKAALVSVDLATGKQTLLGEHPKADISSAVIDPASGRVQAYGVDYLRPEWFAIEDDVKADIAFLSDKAGGAWSVSSQSDDNRLWTIGVDRVTEPYTHYLYDRGAKSLTKLFTTRPALEGKTLSAMYPREIRSRDGLTLVSYLTLPAGSDPDGDGVPVKPLPMVLYVHGGPWARDSYGYESIHQWLANRADALWAAQSAEQTPVFAALLRELAAAGEVVPAAGARGCWTAARPVGRLERMWLELYFRRSLVRATTRWLKHVVSFEGWLDYIVRKANRHAGEPIELTPRERRWPWIFLWGRLVRYLRHKDRKGKPS